MRRQEISLQNCSAESRILVKVCCGTVGTVRHIHHMFDGCTHTVTPAFEPDTPARTGAENISFTLVRFLIQSPATAPLPVHMDDPLSLRMNTKTLTCTIQESLAVNDVSPLTARIVFTISQWHARKGTAAGRRPTRVIVHTFSHFPRLITTVGDANRSQNMCGTSPPKCPGSS